MTVRQAVHIPVHPWFKDHHFNGQAIFPAVESMLLLAGVARSIEPDIQICTMTGAHFSKFLPIPENATEVSALVEINAGEEFLGLKLLSKIQFKKISRVREHAEIYFPFKQSAIQAITQSRVTDSHIGIKADRIYGELVPFGPSYRSLTGTLQISGNTACGSLQAPTLSPKHEMEQETGSPFPLDGAMHAACVLGQCLADFVPFPVGFTTRRIHKPTRAGEQYSTTVLARSVKKDELLFDLSIFDTRGNACETIIGLRMRDVSRGTVKPPQNLPRERVSPP